MNYRLISQTLREIKPSHLSFDVSSFAWVDYSVIDYSTGVMSEYVCEFYTGDRSVVTTDATTYNGGCQQNL